MGTAVSVLIQDAFYGSTIKGQDQVIDNFSMQLALRRLQRLMDMFSNDDLLIYNTNTDSFPMVAGQFPATYSTSLLANGRPVSLDSIYVLLNQIYYDVDLIDQQKFDAIPFKQTSAIPNQCFYNPSFPDGIFNFYPVPYAAFTCYVVDRIAITAAAMTLNSVISLPLGYEKFIVDALSIDIWPSFKGNAPVPDSVRRMATIAENKLKLTNATVMEAVTPFDRSSNISNSMLYKGF